MQELLLKFPAFFEECRPDHSKSFTIDDSITHDIGNYDDEGFSSAACTTSRESSMQSDLEKAATTIMSPGQ
jgi:hypothetical protein